MWGLKMTVRMIPINFGKQNNFSTVFGFRGIPVEWKISNSISSANSQYFLTGPVLNERCCNFAHNFCRWFFYFDPGDQRIPPKIQILTLTAYLGDSLAPCAKIKKTTWVVMDKIANLSFKTGPVKKYWELREKIDFEILNFEKKITSTGISRKPKTVDFFRKR